MYAHKMQTKQSKLHNVTTTLRCAVLVFLSDNDQLFWCVNFKHVTVRGRHCMQYLNWPPLPSSYALFGAIFLNTIFAPGQNVLVVGIALLLTVWEASNNHLATHYMYYYTCFKFYFLKSTGNNHFTCCNDNTQKIIWCAELKVVRTFGNDSPNGL